MSQLVKEYFPLLEFISKIKSPKERKFVLLTLLKDNKLKKVLREIAKNVVEKNIPLTPKEKRMLSKYKRVIWRLKSREKVSNVINQEGAGFFLPLFTVLSTAFEIYRAIKDKNKNE